MFSANAMIYNGGAVHAMGIASAFLSFFPFYHHPDLVTAPRLELERIIVKMRESITAQLAFPREKKTFWREFRWPNRQASLAKRQGKKLKS